MADKSPMTAAGYRKLQEAVAHMKSVERIKCSRAIEEARAHGDLSENAEYHAAKEAQGLLEARIRDMDAKLSSAQVVEVEKLSGDKIFFGARVVLLDTDTGENKTVTIVGELEAEVEQGRISYLSPLARALIGRNVDDIVEVNVPGGRKEYEIQNVSFVTNSDCIPIANGNSRISGSSLGLDLEVTIEANRKRY